LRRKADYLWRRILPREKLVVEQQAVVSRASFIPLLFSMIVDACDYVNNRRNGCIQKQNRSLNGQVAIECDW